MVNQDLGFQLKQMVDRISLIEDRVKEMGKEKNASDDWDNATLMQRWKISKRSLSNYRRSGLDFYKRGGRVFYTPESREKFSNKRKEVEYGTH